MRKPATSPHVQERGQGNLACTGNWSRSALLPLWISLFARHAYAESAEKNADQEVELRVQGRKSPPGTSSVSVDAAGRSVADVAALVENEPGVHVRRLGGDDNFSTLSIRGSSANQVAVYLAGVPLTGGGTPTTDLSTLPLFSTTSAKVYRTLSPVWLGPGSLGGVLAIEPLSSLGKEGHHLELWGGGGSFGTARLRAGVSVSKGERTIAAAASFSRSDGDFRFFDPSSNTFRSRANNDHAKASLYVQGTDVAKIGVHDLSWKTGLLVQAREQGLPGAVWLPTENDRVRGVRVVNFGDATMSLGESVLGAQLWTRVESYDVRGGYDLLSPLARRTSDWFTALGGALKYNWDGSDDFHVRARLDMESERYAPRTYGGLSTPSSASRLRSGLGGEARWTPKDTAFTVVAAARIDGVFDGDPGSSTSAIAPSDAWLPTLQVSGEYERKGLSVALRAGRTSRAPSLVERFGNTGLVLGEPDLRPEYAWSGDVGFGFKKQSDRVSIDLQADAFVLRAEDLITFASIGAFGRIKALNVGRAWSYGAEAKAAVRIAKVWGGKLSFLGSYTWLGTKSNLACSGTSTTCEDAPLPGRPEHDVSLAIGFEKGIVRFRTAGDLVAAMTVDLSGLIRVPTRYLHSAGASIGIPLVKGLRFGVDVQNVFDARVGIYEGAFGPVDKPIGDSFDYPLPGRSVFVSFSLEEQP